MKDVKKKKFFDSYLETTKKNEIEMYVKQFSSFLEEKVAIYISSPITTGQKFITWYNEVGINFEGDKAAYRELHSKEVIFENINKIKRFAHHLRLQKSDVIIEPASFENQNWSQNDYLYYWSSIISKYVKKIIVMEGWEYSRGCVFEYFIGRKLGLEFETQELLKMSNEYAENLINLAIKSLSKFSFDLKMHQIVFEELMKLKADGGQV